MKRIRVTKEFSFEMAHALYRYDGKCENIHGHTYHLSVTVIGAAANSTNKAKEGMVVDFSELKVLVNENVLETFDHACILNQNDPRCAMFQDMATKLVKAPYQPTSENLVVDFVARLQTVLPASFALHSVRLRETPSSFVEWYADDN